ncbi:MAG: hypothetical protein LBK59_06780 [Bifidobacteriaceae bacterium]|jgi:hypothetical protein|nr:hypothetical protein [Bifidobacteriaceae bacterium]
MRNEIHNRRFSPTAMLVTVVMVIGFVGGTAVVANASNKSWNIGSYNVADAYYGGFKTVSGAYASTTVPDAQRWQAWDVQGTGARQTRVANNLTGSYAWGDGDTSPVDVAGIQEVSTKYVMWHASGAERAQRESMKVELNSRGYDFPVSFATLDTAVGDNGRGVGKASHVIYRQATMSVVQSGFGTGRAFIQSANRKADYSLALGSKNDKAYPWAVLKTTGANANEPNRSLLVAAVHSIVWDPGYPPNTSEFNYLFFNGVVQQGVATELNNLSVAGSGGISGMPTVIMGDLNHYYVSMVNNTDTAKSPPKALSDWGMWDARTAYKQTAGNCANNSSCQPYGTVNKANSNGNIIDYIFTYYTGTKTLQGTFKTVADSIYLSDHKMVAARVKYS